MDVNINAVYDELDTSNELYRAFADTSYEVMDHMINLGVDPGIAKDISIIHNNIAKSFAARYAYLVENKLIRSEDMLRSSGRGVLEDGEIKLN